MNFLKKQLKHNDFFGIIIISIFSVAANQYYGNIGVFPHDSFSHFETGKMILNGYHPFNDFWVVSGPFIDYFQAFLFYLFGISWKTYVFHASLINLIVTVSTFLVLRNLNLEFKKSLFFALCFSILAYPSSGTPFVDHHSAFLSLIGVYLIIVGIKKDSKYLSFFISIFFILGFMSKQVPSIYILISTVPALMVYAFYNKKFFLVTGFIYGFVFSISTLLIFGIISGINLSNFIEQYLFYPQSIATNRIEKFQISIIGVLGNFKFIFLSLLILIAANINIIKSNKIFKNKNIYYIYIILISAIVLIFHQVLTRNQIFIFFLIPLIIGIANLSIENKIFKIVAIILCLGSTVKYHERFNENRKFHDLQDVNLNKAIDANFIDKKLNGLRWISPQFKHSPKKEIENINEIIKILKKDTRKKMVLGNYPFLSIIIEEELFSTSRWHVFDGTDYPQVGNHYFNSYKNLFIKKIKDNEIEVIYTILPVNSPQIYNYIEKKCFKKKQIKEYIASHTIKKCDNFN